MKSGDNRDRIETTSAMVLTRERSTTSSPQRKISTSLVSNWNSLGKRTAWELPLLKTLAVLMAGLRQWCAYAKYTWPDRQASAQDERGSWFTIYSGQDVDTTALQARYRPAKHRRVSHNLLIKPTIPYTIKNNPRAIRA
jgi:hypothetical protein